MFLARRSLSHLNVELREENPKTSQENLISFLRGSMSALSYPKLPGDVKDWTVSYLAGCGCVRTSGIWRFLHTSESYLVLYDTRK